MAEKTEREKLLEAMKYEIAAELGLSRRLSEQGWKGLTARETGRIGGMMNQRLHSEKYQQESNGKAE